jgi:hypothetical protein
MPRPQFQPRPRPESVLPTVEAINAAAEASMIRALVEGLREA